MKIKIQKNREGKKQTDEKEAASGESCCRVPIGLRGGTSELSWREPWDGLRDEGQDAGTSLYAGHICTEELAFNSYP
jgi:hypothetical protein